MYFGSYSIPTPANSFQIHFPLPTPSQLIFFFFNNPQSPIYTAHVHRYRTVYCSIINQLVAISVKKTDSLTLPSPEDIHCQQLLSQGWKFMSSSPLQDRILTGLILYKSYAENLNCCQFMSVTEFLIYCVNTCITPINISLTEVQQSITDSCNLSQRIQPGYQIGMRRAYPRIKDDSTLIFPMQNKGFYIPTLIQAMQPKNKRDLGGMVQIIFLAHQESYHGLATTKNNSLTNVQSFLYRILSQQPSYICSPSYAENNFQMKEISVIQTYNFINCPFVLYFVSV